MRLCEKGKPARASLFFRLVAIPALVVACNAPPIEKKPVQITASSDHVIVVADSKTPTLDIDLHIQNTSPNSLQWSQCSLTVERSQYVMALDRRTEEWLEVWRPPCGDTESPQELRSGEDATVPLRIPVSQLSSAGAHSVDGVYRVRFFLSAGVDGEFHQLTPELSLSTPFTVVEQ